MVALLKPDLLPSLLPEYIKLAHQDHEWWDALCVFAGCLLRNNVPLADGLRLFIADVLTDNIEPPKRKTGLSKSVLYHRNLLIWAAINELVSRGMTATRNDASVGHSGLRCGRKGIGTDLQRGLERLAENETGSTMRRAVTTLPEGSTYDPRVLPNAPKNPALEPIRSNIKALSRAGMLSPCDFASRERFLHRWSTLSNPSVDPRRCRAPAADSRMLIDLDRGF